MEAATERLSFLRRRVPAAFEVRLLTLAPGRVRPFVDDEWRGALVVVERGELEVECLRGGRRSFPSGAVLWLTGLPLRALHNPGLEAVLLAAVTRKAGSQTCCRSSDESGVSHQLYRLTPHPDSRSSTP
jgi:hypothetical protein